MKRNAALFGASLAAGALGAAGLIMTSAGSSAAPGNTFAGIAYNIPVTSASSSWGTALNDGEGGMIASIASASPGTVSGFQESSIHSASVSVTTTCVAGMPSVTVTGGGAAGTHTAGTSVSAATFLGSPNAIGTVTFGSKTLGGFTVGAYLDQSASGSINYVALTGANCAAATTSPPTSTPPTSTPPTSTPPTSTGTSTPTQTPTGSPTSTATPTEPPTATPTTTTLPVTG
ncbi:hypothetical protein [Leekyejoonella antrihumi]|uniref:hypothetical protein n=1 Tax=Leekyejoonella antrihumi TaxID=1660198 RepID=UPI001647F531|nr:hypothetical protein [Leekyejoonella antrihumi]